MSDVHLVYSSTVHSYFRTFVHFNIFLVHTHVTVQAIQASYHIICAYVYVQYEGTKVPSKVHMCTAIYLPSYNISGLTQYSEQTKPQGPG